MIYCVSFVVIVVDLFFYLIYLEFILESIYFFMLFILGCYFVFCNICIGLMLLEEFWMMVGLNILVRLLMDILYLMYWEIL